MNKKLSIYLVGGAVRDTILGKTPKDKDYVIVGATSQDVENLIAQGYQRVGADFPVFLHPETGDEYALARIERKVGVGYNGFESFTSPELTIEDDLRRRDLTINAMAMDLDTHELVDPFNGATDLACGVLRHVSEAFAEDPLRVLRVARFQARYGFKIDPSTRELMEKLVESGELDHLTRERVWVEVEKMLDEVVDSAAAFKTLVDVGAFGLLFGDAACLAVNDLNSLSYVFKKRFENFSLTSKFAIISSSANWTEKEMQSMKIPREYQQAHLLFKKIKNDFVTILDKNAEELLKFVENAGMLRQSFAFENIMGALLFELSVKCDNRITVFEKARQAVFAARAKKAVLSVDCEKLASGLTNGKEIAMKIRAARIAALQDFLNSNSASALSMDE